MLLVAAALPAAALSIGSAIKLHEATVELNNKNLVNSAQSVARRVEDEISETLKLAQLLAALPGARSEAGWCDRELLIIVDNFSTIASAALVDPSGTIACAANADVVDRRLLLAAAKGEESRLTVGDSIGAVSVEIPGRPGWRLALAQPLSSPIEAAIDAIGESTYVGVVDVHWRPVYGKLRFAEWIASQSPPPDPGEFLGKPTTFTDTDGVSQRLAMARIARSDLLAYAHRSDPELIHQESAVIIGAAAAPLLTIAFAVIAAWIGIDRLALRWIDHLRRVTEAYGAGRASVRATRLARAPTELAVLGDAFDRMADAVGERTEAAQHQAQARGQLLRELHHRIKNNFQLITSLVSLQKRESPPEVARALSVHERRVGAIAAAYRVSYADGAVGPVGITPLLNELTEVIARHGERPWAQIDLRVNGDLPEIDLDHAVPAALLITKLADARVAGMPDGRASVAISAHANDGRIVIEIEGGARPTDGEGLSSRLRDAVATQIDAKITESDHPSRTTITFPVN